MLMAGGCYCADIRLSGEILLICVLPAHSECKESVADSSCALEQKGLACVPAAADPFSVKVVADPEHLAGPVVQRPEAAQQLAQEARYGNSDKPGVVTHSAREPQFEFSEPFFCVRIYHM